MGTQPFSLMTECVALGCQRIARAAFFFLRDSDGGGTKGPLGLLSLARPEGVEAPQSFLSSYVALFLLHRVSCLGGAVGGLHCKESSSAGDSQDPAVCPWPVPAAPVAPTAPRSFQNCQGSSKFLCEDPRAAPSKAAFLSAP